MKFAQKILLTAIILTSGCSAQSYITQVCDRPPIQNYQSTTCYNVDGLSIVMDNEVYGVVDKNGTMVLPYRYDDLRFHGERNQYLLFRERGSELYGLMTATGQVLIQPQYNGMSSIADKMLMVAKDGNRFIIGNDNQVILPLGRGNVDTTSNYTYTDYIIIDDENGKYGVIDKHGTIILPPTYNYIKEFNDGLAPAQMDGKWGFINTQGELVIPLNYDEVGQFAYGVAAVKSQDKWGVIDQSGAALTAFEFDEIKQFEGKIPNVLGVKKNEKWALFSTSGQQLTPYAYDGLEDGFKASFHRQYDVYVEVLKDGKWGLLDGDGREVIAPQYDSIDTYAQGLIPVSKDGKLGYVDLNNQVVIPFEYYDALPFFENGRAFVYINTEGEDKPDGFMIDRTGKKLISFNSGGIIMGHFYEDGIFSLCIDEYMTDMDMKGNKSKRKGEIECVPGI